MNISIASESNSNPFLLRARQTIDYIDILKNFDIKEAILCGFYIQVGKIERQQGWMLHIPVWDIHFKSISESIFPYLIELNIPFFIPINSDVHSMLQAGLFGYKNLGKIITICPQDEASINSLTNELIKRTKPFKGTYIPTDFYLSNLVYARYGNFHTHSNNPNTSIVDNSGVSIKDEESIPAVLYSWVSWPFAKISDPIKYEDRKVLNNKYYIQKTIKSDVKGRVLVALYQKNFLNFKKCIIKEGKIGMCVDQDGRDIKDRLQWQKIVSQKLNLNCSIPKVIEIFNEQNNCYIVFEFIKGRSFGNLLIDIYDGHTWEDLAIEKKIRIITILIDALKNIENIHKCGVVHRDINIENIFIDNKNKVWMIDLELAYDLVNHYPSPQYEMGTEGFISPEQKKSLSPQIEQDIYSIGCVLILAIAHITPYKFNQANLKALQKNLSLFIFDSEVINLIIACLNYDSSKRPPIIKIIETLEKYKVRIELKLQKVSPDAINNLESSIKASLAALNYSKMLDQDGIWTSPVSMIENQIGNIRMDRIVYTGFRKGISGILFLIGQAELAGVDTTFLNETWTKNFDRLREYFYTNQNEIPTGLFNGSYGVAMAISSLLQAQLLPSTKENLELVRRCLEKGADTQDLATGIAGYGVVLLKCHPFLSTDFIESNLQNCIKQILLNQSFDGSWQFSNNSERIALTSFSFGTAGVIWFLLSYLESYKDPKVEEAALKALKYLQKKAHKLDKQYSWKIAPNSLEEHEFSNGGYNMLLPFIKAYQITERKIYRDIVEGTLSTYPKHIVADFTSIERGLAGLGEVYLDAWVAFENEEWLERASWIAEVLLHTSFDLDKYKFWLQFDPFTPNADFLTGQSGILHFLLRYKFPQKIKSFF